MRSITSFAKEILSHSYRVTGHTVSDNDVLPLLSGIDLLILKIWSELKNSFFESLVFEGFPINLCVLGKRETLNALNVFSENN